MEIIHKLAMDLGGKNSGNRIEVPRGDVNTRKIRFLLRADQKPWMIPEGIAVLIRYQKADGTKGEYDTLPDGAVAWQAEGDALTVTLAPQVQSAAGKVTLYACIRLDDQILNTFGVELNVVAPDDDRCGKRIDASRDYYRLTRVLPGPENAEVDHYLCVEEVDAEGHVIRVKAVGAENVEGKDGIDGKDGADGKDGYTPVRGTDYWTENDKAEMVNDVLNELPVYLGAVEIPGAQQEYLYVLPEATIFDGSNIIDTGVSPFDTPRDFTIYVDITAPNDQNGEAVLIGGDYRMDEVFRVIDQGGYMAVVACNRRQKTDSEISGIWDHTWENISHIALVFKEGVFQFGKYRYNTDGSVSSIHADENVSYKQLDSALTIGAKKATGGVTSSNHWKGTVNDFRIYNRAMTEAEVLALMPAATAVNEEVE